MSHRPTVIVLLALVLASGSIGNAAPDPPAGIEDRPLDSSLVERTERRLIQFDVSLLPKKKRSDAVVPQLVDRGARGMIVSSGRELLQSDLTGDPEELLAFLRRIRHNALQWGEVAYAEGKWARYADIFDLQTLEVGGVPTLLGPLDDRDAGIGGRPVPVRSAPRGGAAMSTAIERAKRRALMHARDGVLLTNRQVRRFAAVLGSFADLDPPRATLYFADIIRKNSGQHYATLFSTVAKDPDTSPEIEVGVDPLREITNDAFAMGLTFDKVSEQAAAHGIRLYTIRARGLELGVSSMVRSGYAQPNQLAEMDRGMRDVDETMIAFAPETGGASFRGGTESSTINKVLDRMQADLSCFYLLSFPRDGLPEDSLLPVRVRFNVDSPHYAELNRTWELRSRGQLLVQSESRRKEAILLAAHTTPGSIESETGRSVLIPPGFVDDESLEGDPLAERVREFTGLEGGSS